MVTPTAQIRSFQFPSNGKVFPNKGLPRSEESLSKGFQFPSNGKVFPNTIDAIEKKFGIEFQFPSNGKVFPNGEKKPHSFPFLPSVSIPFKREGISEQHPLRTQSQCGLKLPIPNATEIRNFFGKKF